MPLREFESLLAVSLIMTPRSLLRCIEVGAAPAAARSAFAPDFSQVPVMRGPRAEGVLRRSRIEGLRDDQHIDEAWIEKVPVLAPGAPLSEAIRALVDATCVLVQDDSGSLVGLIHYSDLNRHPTRLLFYFLLASLEMSLAEGIREVFGDDDTWVRQLSEPRQIQVPGITEWERRRDMRIDTVEATELKDVVKVAVRVREVQTRVGLDKVQATWLRSLLHLRNSTMHPVRRLVRGHDQVRDLHDRLLRLRELASAVPRT
jgi:hypothetical protein